MKVILVNEAAKEIYNEWNRERMAVEEKAKAAGIWNYNGLDSNNHLFKEANARAKAKLSDVYALNTRAERD